MVSFLHPLPRTYLYLSMGTKSLETAQAITSFLEIAIHTLLCVRQIYPPSTFTRRRAHGVPVYQSRHPGVVTYIANLVKSLHSELLSGTLKRMTLVVKSESSGVVLERYLFDVGYMDLGLLRDAGGWNTQLYNAPDGDELSSLFRAFLVRLVALDTQLVDLEGETTFAIVIETEDGKEPGSNSKEAEKVWAPALQTDVMLPSPHASLSASQPTPPTASAQAPLMFVKAVETGVIDLSLLVQEHYAKTT